MTHDTCQALIKAIDAYIAKADDDLSDELKEAGYLDPKATVQDAEELEEQIAEALDMDTEIIAEQIERADSLEEFVENTWEVYRDASALADDIQDVVQNGLSSAIPRLASKYIKATDSGLVVTALRQRTADWISSWSPQLGQIMKLTSHDGIQSILTDAMSQGKSVADVTRELMDSGIRSNYARARQTALTEMLTAHSVAQQESYMQSPAVEGKGWRHTGARRNKPRKNHVDMDGQVVPKAEPFDLTGADGNSYKPMHPRDTNLPPGERINCHCITQPEVSEDVLGLSLSERKRLQAEAIANDDRQWAVELDEQNRARSGNETSGSPINTLLPNGNGGVLKPTRIATQTPGLTDKPNAVVEHRGSDGSVARYFYDDQGKVIMRLDNSDHGQPKLYPFGNGGAHYNRAIYDKRGQFKEWSEHRCITAKMRRLCKDIITDTK